MRKLRDLTGQRFGFLIAEKPDGKDSSGKTKWLCKCDCGTYSSPTMLNLVNGIVKSCGHLKRRTKRMDLVGHKYGKLLVLEPLADKKWRCQCDCGGESNVFVGHLRNGHTQSCGKCFALNRTEKSQARLDTRFWIQAVKAIKRCDACGSKQNLHAHHIMPFAQFPQMRTIEDNGACLCFDCHMQVHKLIRGGQTFGMALFNLIASFDKNKEVSMMLSGSIEDLYKAQHYLAKLCEHESERND
jgi:hypothetical protein